MSSLLLPRLAPESADALRRALLEEGAAPTFSADVLERMLETPRAFPPTGGTRIAAAQLVDFRATILASFEDCGIDAERGADFDLAVGRNLDALGRRSRGEMGVAQVWDFLALVVLPDLVALRVRARMHGQRDTGGLRSRLTGGDRRHVLQRLWKRWAVFGPALVESRSLTEDDYVAVLERTITLERPVVARRVAESVIASGLSGSARREYMRRLMRNLVQMSGVVDLSEHDHGHLDAVFEALHQTTIAAMGSEMPADAAAGPNGWRDAP